MFFIRLTALQLILASFLVGSASLAVAAEDIAIPEPLKPWKQWVLHDVKDNDCPFLFRNHKQRFCQWPTGLSLKLNKSGGTFEQRVVGELGAGVRVTSGISGRRTHAWQSNTQGQVCMGDNA